MGPKPRTRKMIGMLSVILAAIGVILIGYLAVGVAGYLAYPRTVSSNVLKTFPDNPVMQARFLREASAWSAGTSAVFRLFRLGSVTTETSSLGAQRF